MSKKLGLSIFFFILFIILSILVMYGNINNFDTYIYNLVTYKMSDNITIIHKVFTFLGSTLFIVVLSIIIFFFFLIKKKKNCSFIVSGVIIISTIFNNIIKVIIRRKRPEVLALVIEKSFSFPSGHTMASVSLYGILFYILIKSNLNKNIKIIFGTILLIIPILVGVSRIYLGAHFASDVIGAAFMSLSLLLLECHYIDKLEIL